jgi:hypothetical protein
VKNCSQKFCFPDGFNLCRYGAARCVAEMPQASATNALAELEASHPRLAQLVEAAISRR